MPPPPKWISASVSVDPRRSIMRVIAVDAKGDLWMLWRKDDLLEHPPNTWQVVLPVHP